MRINKRAFRPFVGPRTERLEIEDFREFTKRTAVGSYRQTYINMRLTTCETLGQLGQDEPNSG